MNLHINLLPYRQARRLAKVNQLFMIWGGVAFLGLMAAFLTHTHYQDYIVELAAQKTTKEATVAQLDQQLGEITTLREKKELIKKRLELIANLARSRDLTLRILDILSETIPEKVWLTKITTKQNSLELTGKAQSNAMVADFMRTLEASPNISKVDLTRIARQSQSKDTKETKDTKDTKDTKEFTLTAHISYPTPPPDDTNTKNSHKTIQQGPAQ